MKPKTVPQGFSSYQAAWIPDNEDYNQAFEEFDQLYDEKIVEMLDKDIENNKEIENEETIILATDNEKDIKLIDENETSGDDNFGIDFEVDDIDIPDKNKVKDDSNDEPDAPLNEEQLLEKLREEEIQDIEFPDETDIPVDVLGRERYQKYRGLKSFRASPLDPKENLPIDYAKIYQFENPNKTRKVVFSKLIGIEPGKFVTLYIKDVAMNILDKRSKEDGPIVVGGLVKFESKMSVMNLTIRKHSTYVDPIKSKDNIIIHCGFRRYLGNPLFSDHNPKCDKFKYRRFLHDGTFVATIYAPISFPPQPVLYFKDNKFLGSGTVLNVDPDRIITKKNNINSKYFKSS